ncbi:helix-turn-helix domain-containing protein [Phaeobacter sp. JH20_41]|uniref:helix-turn-helix domain-containing protein n=1 Tax=Phaeobacter sp. JH20_41 TaxID=3112498 RepID=UPI003A87B7CA
MTTESLIEMELRHAKERAELVEKIRQDAYTAGLHDRMKPGSVATPSSLMEQVTETVAMAHKVLPSELRGPSRFDHFKIPRRKIWAELHDRGYSLEQIGQHFGRHHTTILSGIQKHKAELEKADG